MIQRDFIAQLEGVESDCDRDYAICADEKKEAFIEWVLDAVGGGWWAIKGDEGGDLQGNGVGALEFVEIGKETVKVTEMGRGLRL